MLTYMLKEKGWGGNPTMLTLIKRKLGQSNKYQTKQILPELKKGIKWTNSLKYTNYTKVIQEEIDNLNNSVAIKEIEFLVKNLLTKKTLGPYSFVGKFHQTFKQDIIPILHKFFQKIDEEEIRPKSLCEDHSYLYQNQKMTLQKNFKFIS